jgi:hypothetical protein
MDRATHWIADFDERFGRRFEGHISYCNDYSVSLNKRGLGLARLILSIIGEIVVGAQGLEPWTR